MKDLDALIATLLCVILHVNGNEVSDDLEDWAGIAAKIAKKYGIAVPLKVIVTKTLKGKDIPEEEIVAFGKLLKPVKIQMDLEPSIPKDRVGLIRDCALSLGSNSDAAWNRLEKDASILRIPFVTKAFTPENQEDYAEVAILVSSLKKLALKLTGVKDLIFLTPAEMGEARLITSKESTYKSYLSTRSALNKIVKGEVFRFVREYGEDLVPINLVLNSLKSKGIVNNLPIGFVGGLIDESGKMYTKERRMLDKIPFGIVVMNPKYDPTTDNTYVMNIKGDSTIKYRTLAFSANNKKERHEKVAGFLSKEKEYVSKWREDLGDNTKKGIMASMVEIMYTTSCRIGGKDNATKGEPTYGLTTLELVHITMNPSSIEFNYAGKKLAEQEHSYNTTTRTGKMVRKTVEYLIKGKKPNDLIFTYSGKEVSRNDVNSYLKSIGCPITAHRFRQVSGTKLAASIISKSEFKKSDKPKQAVVDAWVKQELTEVGTLLHHKTGTKVTGMTAVKSYIDPEVLVSFYQDLGLSIPNWIPGHTKTGDRSL